MSPSTFTAATFVAGLLATGASAAYNAASTQNIAMYWGQGNAQIPLSQVCSDDSVDIVNIAFVNGFPTQVGDYPKTNFANACWGYYPDPNNSTKDSGLLQNCPGVEDAINACQAAGKKVLLSLGGGAPTDYYLASTEVAEYFAEFLLNVFGPKPAGWTGPRPFGAAAVDGFDLDLEADAANVPSPELIYKNYDSFVGHVKTLAPAMLISSAPQCVVPDVRLSDAISKVSFDMIFTQFYNTDACSARRGYTEINDATTGFTFDAWAEWLQDNSFNPNVKLYLGLAAGTDGLPTNKGDYLKPDEANALIAKYQKKWPSIFGGVMLWEATVSVQNKMYNQPYDYWMKAAVEGTFTSLYKPVASSSSIASSSTRASSTRLASSTRVSSTRASSTRVPSSTRVSSTRVSSSTRVASSSVRSSTVRSSSVYVTSSVRSSSIRASSSSVRASSTVRSSSAYVASSAQSSSVYSASSQVPSSSSVHVVSSSSAVHASSSVYSAPSQVPSSSSVHIVSSSSAVHASSSVYSASSHAPSSSSVHVVSSSSAVHASSSVYSASSPAASSSVYHASSQAPASSSAYSVRVSSSAYSVASSSVQVASSSVYVAHSSSSSSSGYPASSPSVIYVADTTKIVHPSSTTEYPESTPEAASSTPCTTSSKGHHVESSSAEYPASTPEAASSVEYPASTPKAASSTPCSTSSKGHPVESSSAQYPASTLKVASSAEYPASTPEAASSTPCSTSSKGYPAKSSSAEYPVSTPEAASSAEYPASTPEAASSTPCSTSSKVYVAKSSSIEYPAYPTSSSTAEYPAYPASSSEGYASYPSVTKKPQGSQYPSYPTGTSTTVVTTTYVDVCSTGLTTITTTYTKTVCAACAKPTKEAEYPEGWTTSVYVDQTMTVTITKPIHPATDVPAYPTSAPAVYPAGSDKPVYPAEYPKKPEESYPEQSSAPAYPVEAATSTLVQYVTLTKVAVPYTAVPYASSAPSGYAPVPYGSTNGTSAYAPQPTSTGKPTKPSSYTTPEFEGAASRFGVGMTALVAVVAAFFVL